QRFETAVSAIQDSDTFRRWLDVSARFHQYSLGNQLLIAAARPDATYVAGYHAWLKLGRQVKRGEKGIAIMVPHARKVALDDGTGERRGSSFGAGWGFDGSSTEGDSLPALEVPTLGGDGGGEVWHGLAAVVVREGVGLRAAAPEQLPRQTMGYYLPDR